MAHSLETEFQKLCHEKQIAATHQRLVLYRALMQMPDHPNPEQVFDRVRGELPSISLATVYNTLHLFMENGIIREVSPHHGSMRIEPNTERHHHFLCLQCHSITDLSPSEVDEMPLKSSVPEGFRVDHVTMEVCGVCRLCAETAPSAQA
jgi:Fur family peroxide stress response transcriptional regulator